MGLSLSWHCSYRSVLCFPRVPVQSRLCPSHSERLDVLCVIQQRLSHRWVKPSDRKKGKSFGGWHKAPVPNVCHFLLFSGVAHWPALLGKFLAPPDSLCYRKPRVPWNTSPTSSLWAAGVFALRNSQCCPEEVIWAGPSLHSFIRHSASIYWVSTACQAPLQLLFIYWLLAVLGLPGCVGFSLGSRFLTPEASPVAEPRLQGVWASGTSVHGLQTAGSVVVAHRLSHSMARGILPGQGLNPGPQHCPANSSPLSHQGSPLGAFSISGNKEQERLRKITLNFKIF